MIPASLRAAMLAAVFVVAVPSLAPAADMKPAAGDDPVIAVVNGEKVHFSEVEAARERLPERFQQFPREVLFGLLVNSLIDTKLMATAARKRGLHQDADVKRQMTRIEDQILERAYLTRAIEERTTEAVIKERYERMAREKGREDEVHALHILVKTEAQAKEVIVDLAKGTNFNELARKRSIDPAAANGGDLGFFSRGRMVPAFAEAAFALDVNQTSATPVQTQFGWHVIRVVERRKAPPPTFEEVEEEVRSELSREIGAAVVDELRKGATIERFRPDGAPVAR